MSEIARNIAAFDGLKPDLEKSADGRWALVHNEALIDTYESFDAAAQDAVRQFGRGPYLIRQVGLEQLTLPASVMCNFRP